MSFTVGDLVRVDIPDETDPDFEQFHGRNGKIVNVISDSGGSMTGDDRDGFLYTVELENGLRQDFRWRDLRPR